MTRQHAAQRLNLLALADGGAPLIEQTPLYNLERLAHESICLQPDLMVFWQAAAELRTGPTGQTDTWLHLQAKAVVPLVCQRCMTPVQLPLAFDRWYRFVATEDIAMAEDDAADEDLLVMAPHFDLLGLLEDELLMALPLVPMHDECPVTPAFTAGAIDLPDSSFDKPNPFAALAKLKQK